MTKGYVHPDFTDKFSEPSRAAELYLEDGFSMTDYDRAWRESVDAKLDRILWQNAKLLELQTLNRTKPVKPKVERPAKHFPEFWKLYPKKSEKKDCLAMWKRKNLDEIAVVIIADVKERIAMCPKWKAGYSKDPIRYLRGELWTDEIQIVASVPVEVPKELNALVRYAAKSGLQAKVGEPLHEFRARVVREVAGSDE